jgi:maltose O-acetyltransferase
LNFLKKAKNFTWRKLVFILFQYPRILKYKLISDAKNIKGTPLLYQPTQFLGQGLIQFGKNVRLGVNPSPFLYNGYMYIDSRKENSKISFGDDIWINNNFSAISEGEGIEIGEKTLIGHNCEIFDSDFHDLNPEKRLGGTIKTAKVKIGSNCFIGSNVKILKGVSIGNDSVIANGSVVSKSIPERVIAGGIPAKVIRSL